MAAKIKKRMIDDIIEKTDYAFQPIVSVHSGILMAVEALIRNYETVGFETIEALFDVAYEKKLLYRLDLALRGKALEKYKTICIPHEFKLFYNIDNRVLLMPDYEIGNTTQLLKDHNLQHNLFCFEISEKAPLVQEVNMKRILTNYKNQNFFIAVDDYGAGFSGLMQLYKTEPHFIKIDRFFIQGINLDVRKKKFVASMVNLAHIIGVQVIAEGVETMEEFVACREIGCEYVQGNFVQKPQTDVNEIRVQYDLIEHIAKKEQRQGVDDRDMILLEMSRYEPIVISESTTEDVLNYFRRHSHKTFVPVVNRFEEPVGIIQEMILKKYVYSPYGKELLRNRKSRENVYDLVSAAPACELSTNVENIIELYNKNKEGVG
ncbi:MAG: EAL domain-containing protein, partial [Spirochaetota bacterium]